MSKIALIWMAGKIASNRARRPSQLISTIVEDKDQCLGARGKIEYIEGLAIVLKLYLVVRKPR